MGEGFDRIRARCDRAVGGFNRRPPKPGKPPWNHNVAYHRVVLAAVPAPCPRALDVGCGTGLLVRRLAEVADLVVGLDPDPDALAAASRNLEGVANVDLIEGDVLKVDLGDGGFDLVAAVAVLHHLPLDAGLARLASLVRPGGSLVVVGLRRDSGPIDLALSALAFPVANLLVWRRGHTPVGAPVADPVETLADIRAAAARHVPGATIRRRLLFRYTLVWHRPAE